MHNSVEMEFHSLEVTEYPYPDFRPTETMRVCTAHKYGLLVACGTILLMYFSYHCSQGADICFINCGSEITNLNEMDVVDSQYYNISTAYNSVEKTAITNWDSFTIIIYILEYEYVQSESHLLSQIYISINLEGKDNFWTTRISQMLNKAL